MGRGLEVATGHQRLRGQRKVAASLDDDGIADAPAQPKAGHLRVAISVEIRVVATHGEHKLAAMLPLEPDHIGEAAGQLDILVEQPRVVSELPLHPQHAFRAGKPDHQGELDRHQGHLGARQGHARQTQHVDVEAIADLDRHHRDAIDQREAVEGQAGREPERALLHREVVAKLPQLNHRFLRLSSDVEGLDKRVLCEFGEVLRHLQAAVDAKTAADAREEEGWRTADGAIYRSDREEGRELFVVRLLAFAVAAIDGDAVNPEATEQHAEVLGTFSSVLLEQAPGDRHTGDVRRDGQAGKIHSPGVRAEEIVIMTTALHDVGDLKIIDSAAQSEHRDRAVHQQRDALQAALGHGRTEADLLQIERPKSLLDGDPPGAVAVTRSQRDGNRVRAVLLDGQSWGEGRFGGCRPGIPHHTLGDAILAFGSPGGHGQVGELELYAATSHAAAIDGRIGVQGDGLKGQANIQQRAGGFADAQTNSVHHQAWGELQGQRVRQETDEQAAVSGGIVLDPGIVIFQPQGDVPGDQREAAGQPRLEPDDATHLGELNNQRVDRDPNGNFGDITEQLVDAGKQGGGVEQTWDQRGRIDFVPQHHAAHQVAHIGSADAKIEQVLHRRLRHGHAGHQVRHHLHQAQRHLGRPNGIRRRGNGPIAGDQVQVMAVQQPAHGEPVQVVNGHAESDPPSSEGTQPGCDRDEGTQGDTPRINHRGPSCDAKLVEPSGTQCDGEADLVDPRDGHVGAREPYRSADRVPGERQAADGDFQGAAIDSDSHRRGNIGIQQRGDRREAGRSDGGESGRQRPHRIVGPVAQGGAIELLRGPGAQRHGIAHRLDKATHRAWYLSQSVQQERQGRFGSRRQRPQPGKGDERNIRPTGGPEEELNATRAETGIDSLTARCRPGEPHVHLDAEAGWARGRKRQAGTQAGRKSSRHTAGRGPYSRIDRKAEESTTAGTADREPHATGKQQW